MIFITKLLHLLRPSLGEGHTLWAENAAKFFIAEHLSYECILCSNGRPLLQWTDNLEQCFQKCGSQSSVKLVAIVFLEIFIFSLFVNSKNSCSFIHSGYFYSAPSSPLLLRGAPDYSTVLEFHAEAHRQP